ncbi:MAG: low specificity L-threonine aldolase [Lachnospiraceae bacterium]|nr:low specificity L-threonine aldolase [Lachnospiraceae bacterium]
MFTLVNDYSEGAHEKILQRLLEVNYEKIPGYGTDDFCRSAAEKIKLACDCPEAEVYFMFGGTQTNQVVIDTMCASYQGVIAVETGHVNTHEAGAIEYSGHKVMTVKGTDGKMDPDALSSFLKIYMADASIEHMVYPGMVYISHPTELGTLYTKAELSALHEICASYEIPLFIDGARLGYGLMAKGTDVTLPDIARYADVFYIGGTKVGALFGEALVFTRHNMPKRFNTMVKQHGAMAAKGWMAGLQFDVLFTDGIYFENGRNGIEKAEKLRKALIDKGYEFLIETPTNQIFVVLDNDRFNELKDIVGNNIWSFPDDSHTAVRFVTSWATTDDEIDNILNFL